MNNLPGQVKLIGEMGYVDNKFLYETVESNSMFCWHWEHDIFYVCSSVQVFFC